MDGKVSERNDNLVCYAFTIFSKKMVRWPKIPQMTKKGHCNKLSDSFGFVQKY